jgi:hypothetical protein
MRMNDLLLHNAYSQHQRGKLGEAARLYGEILRANPKHPDLLSMRGLIHLRLGEVANAAADEAIRHGMVPPGLHTISVVCCRTLAVTPMRWPVSTR